MAYEVVATPQFERDYRKLPPEMPRRVPDKIDLHAEHPEQLRFPLKYLPESLKGLPKYRVGDYRILLWPEHEYGRIVLYAVAHRSEIYRGLQE